MISEFNLILGGAVGAAASGIAGLAISALGVRRARAAAAKTRERLAWEHRDAPELTRNLLVLEMVSDEIETTPTEVAIRARLTPTELRDALRDLSGAGFVEESAPGLFRLTEIGRGVLANHKLELQESLLSRRARRAHRPQQSPEELDIALANAVESLRAQQA